MALTTDPAPQQAAPTGGRHAVTQPTDPAQSDASATTPAGRSSRFLSIPLIILGAFAALLAASYIIAIFALGTVKPAIATVGHSMNPLLYQGDLVLIKSTNPAEVQVGDVISLQVTPANQQRYGLPGTIVHRVVAVQDSPTIGRLFTTKGDNNAEKDSFITLADNVNGVMVAHVPKLGYPLLYIQGPSAPLLGAVLGGLIIIYLIIGWAEVRGKEAAAREQVITQLASELPELQTQLDRLATALTFSGAAVGAGAGSVVVGSLAPPRSAPLVPVESMPTPAALPAAPVAMPAAPIAMPAAPVAMPAAPVAMPAAPVAAPAPAWTPAPSPLTSGRDDFDPLTAPFDEVQRRLQGSEVPAP